MGENKKIFKKGSRTFYNSSKFFPLAIREKVTILYAFVRKADDMVDSVPAKKEDFYNFKKSFYEARNGKQSNHRVINDYLNLENELEFNKDWMDAFLETMEKDLSPVEYKTIEDTEKYMYGSANVIGLFMARIMALPDDSYKTAELLGKSFQFINFIRDIKEDMERGRTYLPKDDLIEFGIDRLTVREVMEKKDGFIKLIRFEIDRFFKWYRLAKEGYKFIPKDCLAPIKTAADLYEWTAKEIYKNPLTILSGSVKPSVTRILLVGSWNKWRIR